MNTTKLRKTTRTIAGRNVTLLAGVRYVASRPSRDSFDRRPGTWPVTIQAAVGGPLEAESIDLADLTRAEAQQVLAAFNCTDETFDGRVW